MFAGTIEYMVKPGDSLSLIAKKYGRPLTDWKKIFDLNADQITNPDLIQPGWVLKLPVNWDEGTTPPPATTKKAAISNYLIWGAVGLMALYLIKRKR